jgi:archaemetzincin
VRRTILVVLVVLNLLLLGIMAFKVPDEPTRIDAIGSLEGLPQELRRALEPGDDFLPMNKPGPHDWLANHPEPGQSFDQYVKQGFVKPDKRRNKIYLLPIGEFAEGKSPSLTSLKQCASGYFGLDVKVLAAIDATGHGFTTRTNPYTEKRQILTHDILSLLKKKLPGDAFCILGITMEDLYPDPDWNFVFGMASLYERVGVFSFARYDPAFYGDKRGKDYRQVLLRRSCKVLTHETGHMFGLKHCTFYQCGMAGSNHLEESDARPIHLCPVCLRKLQYNIGFDVVDRYRKLEKFYRRFDLDPEASWIRQRIEHIQGKQKK